MLTDGFKSVRCEHCSEYIVNGAKGWRRPLSVPLDIKTLRTCKKNTNGFQHSPVGAENAPLLRESNGGRKFPSNGEILHLKSSPELQERRTRARRKSSVSLQPVSR